MADFVFKHSSSGYVDLMNERGVQNMLNEKAKAVQTSALSSLSDEGYTSIDGFEKVEGQFKDGRKVQNVFTHSLHAMRSQNKNKTLTKALGSAGGSS